MCTQYRWLGNNKGKKRMSDLKNEDKTKEQKNETKT
jgi:hypothetical protein